MVMPSQARAATEAALPVWQGSVALIAKPGGSNTGIGRYVEMLQQGLNAINVAATRVTPVLPPLPACGYTLLRKRGMDLQAFLNNYPVWARYPQAEVYHLTSQNLASLLLFKRPNGRVVVTVHDILPYMLRNTPQLCVYRTVADRIFDWLAMVGLRRADQLIADSHYTRKCIAEYLKLNPAKIAVAHLGIDHERFCPQAADAKQETLKRYGLAADRCYLIYVGSEDPRKNVSTLIRAVAEVRRQTPDVELIKVGRAHFTQERHSLLELSQELGIREAIHFLNDVPEHDLPLLYALADVCVMPSLYEGFGLPALEAMACGTPLVCARATSLPELVASAALLVDQPTNPRAFANAIQILLSDQALYQTLRERGLVRVRGFDWYQYAQHVTNIYQKVGIS